MSKWKNWKKDLKSGTNKNLAAMTAKNITLETYKLHIERPTTRPRPQTMCGGFMARLLCCHRQTSMEWKFASKGQSRKGLSFLN